MKKTYMALGVMALTVITTVGLATATMAASRNGNSTNNQTRVSEVDREAHRAEMETKRTAAQAALLAGDYKAWVAAEGVNAPILKTINESNFARFVEAHKLQNQARLIMTELGVERGMGREMGMGQGQGMGRGMSMGLHQGLNR